MQVDPWMSPISTDNGLIRTPTWVAVQEDLYIVCVGDKTYRHFDSKTVPNQIKALITMVRAFPLEVRMSSRNSGVASMTYYVPPDYRLKDIGWQLDADPKREVYMLVLAPNAFDEVANGRNAGKKS